MEKKCFKCFAILPLDEFYKHSRMADGHLNKCKICTKNDAIANRNNRLEYYREYDRKRRLHGRTESLHSNERWAIRNRHKRVAHVAVGNAVRDGRLFKKPCEICGSKEVQAHHDDYSKLLDVRWLCVTHHAEHHKRERKEIRQSLALRGEVRRYLGQGLLPNSLPTELLREQKCPPQAKAEGGDHMTHGVMTVRTCSGRSVGAAAGRVIPPSSLTR